MCADHLAFLYFFISYTDFCFRGGKTLFCEINLLKKPQVRLWHFFVKGKNKISKQQKAPLKRFVISEDQACFNYVLEV